MSDERERRDPRDIVTQHAFRVNPELLGAPLAGPFRRGVAILLDLFLIAILYVFKAATGGLLDSLLNLGILLGTAWILWRLGGRGRHGWNPGRGLGIVLRTSAVIVAIVGVVTFFGGDEEDPADRRVEVGRATAAERRVERELERVDSVLPAGPGERDAPGPDPAAEEDRVGLDSLVARYRRARASGDEERAEEARDALRGHLTGTRLARLARENERLEDRLEDQLEEAREPKGLVQRGVAVVRQDLGIGLPWMAVYFTFFLAFWNGQTPGKKLLGCRVVNLDGQPLGWWDAFGRFGGYAAGLATGTLGFLQLFWDPNRQGVHDKIAGTVVVRTRGRKEAGAEFP